MLKIGEFSKLSMLTVKALRFYEKEGVLIPAYTDSFTGYRMYETAQLEVAAKIKALRQLDFTVAEVKSFLSGAENKDFLETKRRALQQKKEELDKRISVLQYLSEEKNMKYQTVVKTIPQCTVYCETKKLKDYSEVVSLILGSAEECLRINPDMQCSKPDYCFCEYLDGEYRKNDITVRYSQAVVAAGQENERIKFRVLPETKALCIYHKGPYDRINEAYAFIMKYANENGYEIADCPRECYIDGMWNKENPEDWLTEIQVPVKD